MELKELMKNELHFLKSEYLRKVEHLERMKYESKKLQSEIDSIEKIILEVEKP